MNIKSFSTGITIYTGIMMLIFIGLIVYIIFKSKKEKEQ
jgi:cbb3-type cytochrome oxidase subunit 3